jgi:hypothetical protein
MGSSAMHSFIQEVLAEHGDELLAEVLNDLPKRIKALGPRVELEPEVDELQRWLVLESAEDGTEYLALASLTIFDLERRFGDPEVETVW